MHQNKTTIFFFFEHELKYYTINLFKKILYNKILKKNPLGDLTYIQYLHIFHVHAAAKTIIVKVL